MSQWPIPHKVGIWTPMVCRCRILSTWPTSSPWARQPPSVPWCCHGPCWWGSLPGTKLPGTWALVTMGSLMSASWSCQLYITCCSRRSLCIRCRPSPGYRTQDRLWVWWLLAEASQILGWLPWCPGIWGTGRQHHRCHWASDSKTITYCHELVVFQVIAPVDVIHATWFYEVMVGIGICAFLKVWLQWEGR